MKADWTHLDAWREPHPITGYLAKGDTMGCFRIPHYDARLRHRHMTHFIVMASNGEDVGWEHVSIHARYRDGLERRMRTPMWEEMCWIKDLFWEETEAVMQIHPAKADHINLHNHVLHLWRPTAAEIPTPPLALV